MIVLDCNAAFAMILDSPEGRALKGLMLDGETAIAPCFYRVEVGNVLWKYVRAGNLSQDDIGYCLSALDDLVDELYDDGELMREAVSEAVRLQHSVYDMLYFVLARRTGATLFTVDRKLQNLCLDNGVECIYSTVLPE